MLTAYIVVTILAAVLFAASAAADFARYEKVLVNMKAASVPLSWITMLGGLKAAGALGLLIGIAIPAVGVAAAAGLILFFVGAIATHYRARMGAYALPAAFLTLAVVALLLRLATA